ncbi:MAG: phosphoglucomutase/phosphomannomutase family protein, partial [Acidobacteria bacterium]|nr:phosphoglucomutase/phosphomannomutase family protein [Acidobacteriota bacterium]
MAGNRIKFGTSGWRALIAEDFTFANVRIAVEAIAGHVLSKSKSPTLLVGHDTRFLGEEFAQLAGTILKSRGIRVLLCQGPTPTPAIAYEIIRRKTDGAINFTASHNPSEYQGLKFSGVDGGPALPEVTKDIERRAAELSEKPAAAEATSTHSHAGDEFELVDLRPTYLARLEELVDFSFLQKAKLKIFCDPVYGCGAGYLDRVLADHGIAATAIRTNRDVLFGGHGPDPSETNLPPLKK